MTYYKPTEDEIESLKKQGWRYIAEEKPMPGSYVLGLMFPVDMEKWGKNISSLYYKKNSFRLNYNRGQPVRWTNHINFWQYTPTLPAPYAAPNHLNVCEEYYEELEALRVANEKI